MKSCSNFSLIQITPEDFEPQLGGLEISQLYFNVCLSTKAILLLNNNTDTFFKSHK